MLDHPNNNNNNNNNKIKNRQFFETTAQTLHVSSASQRSTAARQTVPLGRVESGGQVALATAYVYSQPNSHAVSNITTIYLLPGQNSGVSQVGSAAARH
jgi:hypothetical protein